jgi:DNA-binding response OmpR family regulator
MIKASTVLLISRKTQLYADLKRLLKEMPFQVSQVAQWEDAEADMAAEVAPPHLILLDCTGAGMNGLMICQEIHNHYAGLLVLISENKDERFHRLALDLGADASLCTSAGAPLLVANIKALLRRFGPVTPPSVISFGKLTVDANRRDAFMASQAANLSTIEFQLIWYLAQKSGCVVSREEIYQELHSSTYNGYDRRIDVYMSRIRQKIGDDPTAPSYLKTVRGVGYQFMANAQKGR